VAKWGFGKGLVLGKSVLLCGASWQKGAIRAQNTAYRFTVLWSLKDPGTRLVRLSVLPKNEHLANVRSLGFPGVRLLAGVHHAKLSPPAYSARLTLWLPPGVPQRVG
jgi:hypothetical protein